MKKALSLLLVALMLAGCASNTIAETAIITEVIPAETEAVAIETMPVVIPEAQNYVSSFDSETVITLSDDGITVDGGTETESVYTSHDITYYEEKVFYESGYPYGEGSKADQHTAEEADAHTVVNITAPGAYRVSGTLTAGQIRVDLGENAFSNPDAVVELILDGADITCTVAPAILFLNTYECDGEWSTETAKSVVDTASAGANLVLESENTVSGSYVAKIFKDAEGEKKLWKQDGAIYSYMSLNVFGPGSLALTAENEGLDTELHLTIHGGNIVIRSSNDGINTNEDGVSVTTINGGNLHIIAGLGDEGDGIDSNGYLVINGGTVISTANPAADAGLDSDMGSFINGGTVVALGSTMDWAESDSNQVTMNLQFSARQTVGSAISVTDESGNAIFTYNPAEEESLSENARPYQGAILSCPAFAQGETYNVYVDGVQMQYTGTDFGMGGPGGMGQMPGGNWPTDMERPEEAHRDFDGEMPEGFGPGNLPEGFTLPEDKTMPEEGFGGRGQRGERPEGTGGEIPEGFDGKMPTMPEGETFPEGEMPEGGFGSGRGHMGVMNGEPSTAFYMSDKVNAFTGIAPVTE